MTKPELAWEELVKSEPYFNPRDLYEVYRQMFLAGYNAARAEDIKAMCYMCAKPEKYGEPEFIPGSMRLWHLVGESKWNAGQCWAQPVREYTLPTCTKCGHSGMLNTEGICTYDCTSSNVG